MPRSFVFFSCKQKSRYLKFFHENEKKKQITQTKCTLKIVNLMIQTRSLYHLQLIEGKEFLPIEHTIEYTAAIQLLKILR